MSKGQAGVPVDWTDYLDGMPLGKRPRTLPSDDKPSSSSSPPSGTERSSVEMGIKRASTCISREEWPGLPRGLKFDPSDEDLLWHLIAKVGKGGAEPHPLISEFIISLDEYDSFGDTHPQKLAGVKQDGSASYFFHRRFKAFNSRNGKRRTVQNADFGVVYWHEIGKTKPVIIDGIHLGGKRIMVLYVVMEKGEKPEKTNWVLHQYHLGRGEEGDGEFVASKIFYQQKSRQSNRNSQEYQEIAEAVIMEAEAAFGPVSPGPKIHAANQHVDLKPMETSSQDDLSRFSGNLIGNIKGYVTGQVLDEHHANGVREVAVAEFVSNSPSDSPASTVTASSGAANESPPHNSPVKEEEHEYMVANSEPHSSVFSALLVQAGPLEESNVIGSSEMDTVTEYTAEMSGSGDKGFKESYLTATCSLPEARNSPNNLLSEDIVTQKSNGKHFNEAQISKFELSNLGQTVVRQNDDIKLSDSANSTFPSEVKAEPLEESYTKGIQETTAELPQCDNIHLFDSFPSTFPVEVKAEPLGECYTNSAPEVSGQELPIEILCAPSQCSLKYKLLSADGNVQENVLVRHLQDETNICAGQESEGIHLDAPRELHNAHCTVRVKEEPMEREKPVCNDPTLTSPEFSNLIAEVNGGFLDEHFTDLLDHIPLKHRINMLLSNTASNLDGCDSLKCSQKTAGGTSHCGPHDLHAKSRRISLRKKRKKTATDSVETALEEDAPGLLQVLLDKGITTEEIKLYGDKDELLDISSDDDSFEELEAVITKLFSERSSLVKFSAGRQINGSKAVYCLACLISLIEQTRYLRFRDSPVEWGWCRDLQSFIFVFEVHNRIVLERPEYGYATYFFELLDSVPVDWQIKRLVTTMKISSCSRTTLIENRAFVVGEDLSEGEAHVLEEYGWTPNTGLGTMLNYCERVVHDKRSETYSLDWRAKIGKLLMNGHDAGRTIMTNLPMKVAKYMGNAEPEVKSEALCE